MTVTDPSGPARTVSGVPPDGSTPYRTIPQVLSDAARRDPDGTWLRTDDGSLTFGGAAAQVAGTAQALREAGVGHGDLVLVTARTTGPYLLCWLALASIGAVTVSANPRSAPAELAGLAHQTRPRAIITDSGLAGLVSEADIAGVAPLGVLDADELTAGWAGRRGQGQQRAGRRGRGQQSPGHSAGPDAPDLSSGVTPGDLAVLIPTSGTTGRSKLVMQTHRAYAMAGEGFPFWMELTPADRMMTSLPLFHINAPAYSMMGSLACGAGLILLPRFSASTFLDSARRHGATEFNAIGAMLEILMRQEPRPGDADTPLRLCYTGPAPTRERQEEMERRFGLRIVVGYAMSESPYGLIWAHGTRPYGTLGTPRQHPRLGVVNEAKVIGPDGAALPPGDNPGVLGHAGRDGRGDHQRRLAAHRRPGHAQRRRHLHVRGQKEGGAAPPGREPLPRRGRGSTAEPPVRARSGGRGGSVGAVRGGGEGVRRARAGRQHRFRRLAGPCREPACLLQGAPLLAGHRCAAAHPDDPGCQAPAAAGSPSG